MNRYNQTYFIGSLFLLMSAYICADHHAKHHTERHCPDHKPDHKPDHHCPDHKPDHHCPDHKPDHHCPDHKPDHHCPDKPDHHCPDHKPDHHCPDHKPDHKPDHHCPDKDKDHDKNRNIVIATINTGVTPTGIALTHDNHRAITHDNHRAYVANNNNYGIDDQDTVTVLDLKNNTVITTISDSSFNQPYTVTINPKGNRAYVTNSNSTTITVINTATNQVVGIISGFDGPSGMVITPDGKFGYVNNYGSPSGVGSGNGTTVRVVNLKTNSIIGSPIIVGLAPAALAISPNGKFVYVINYVDGNPETGTMSIIRTKTNTVIDTITGFSGPFGIAITPDDKHAYVTNFGSNNFDPIGTTVSIVNLFEREIVKTVEVGIQPAGVAITPDGHFAYVTNYNTLYAGENFTDLTAGQGTVNIIDTHKKKVVPPTIAVDQSPHAIAISSNGKRAYVTNFTSNTVNVIKIKN